MRNAVAAGSLYPSDAGELKSAIMSLMNTAAVSQKEVGNAVAYVAPHSDYRYAGSVAAYTYKALSMNKDINRIDTFVIVGPNQKGIGTRIAISEDSWQTPLGDVENDKEFAEELIAMSVGMVPDEEGHRLEHSIEMQLPFLQHVVKRPKCCFISMLDQTEDASRAVAHDVDSVRKRLGKNIVMIAASDLDSNESDQVARGKDMPLIEKLMSFDTRGFYSELNNSMDSASGFGPMAAVQQYARMRKAKSGKLLKYATSADITGNKDSVVGYASVAFA
ncbi:MAG: AmmeMemoRadiSam system protein B [Candidatus Micrarchaeota archaeon]|nr:AmmeMemoRadiSam system protein B [Candidatus Micrarchaeota archaeon]